jgi:nucleoside-diphosphate-sugar epimerase
LSDARSNDREACGPESSSDDSGQARDARVLVTGATGFIGFEVARQLAAANRRPRLLVRRSERRPLLGFLDAELVCGDLMRPETLAAALEGVDEVIHLAARATFERYETLRPTIVDGSISLMNAARRAGVRRFVFASSLLVYGHGDRPIDARTPARPRLGYGIAKLEAEEALRRAAEASRLSLGIIRLPHVYGPRSFLFHQLRRGFVIAPGPGTNTHGQLHVADAARLLVAAADQGWSGTTPVADDSPRSWNQFFEVLGEHYARFRLVRMPSRIAQAGARLLEAMARLRGRPTLQTADTVRGWLLDLPVEPGLLWGDLGLEPLYRSIERGIPASLDEGVSLRWRHPVLDRAEALVA